MIDLGIVKPGATVYVPWGSYDLATGASEAASNYADADILVYKDGSTTQRASASGLTATTTFDTITGMNLTAINLAGNTTAGFWAAKAGTNIRARSRTGIGVFIIFGPPWGALSYQNSLGIITPNFLPHFPFSGDFGL